jgi:predicted neuraminidase
MQPLHAVDSIITRDGILLLVFNDSQITRAPLTIASSVDGGNSWIKKTNIIPETQGQFSYPSIIQGQNRDIHITLSWQRKNIAHLKIESRRISELIEEE